MIDYDKWLDKLKEKFCHYAGIVDLNKAISDADIRENKWNAYNRVMLEEGCTEEALLEALKRCKEEEQ